MRSQTAVCYCTKYWIRKAFKQLKMTLSVIKNDAFRQITYSFLIVFHCNYISILYRFPDIIVVYVV